MKTLTHWILGITALLVLGLTQPSFVAAKPQQETFATPEKAVEKLVAAHRKGDTKTLRKIFGPHGENLIESGDPVADKRVHEHFLKAYDAAHNIESEGDERRILVIGAEQWPLPIPIVKEGKKWRFDTTAGEKEILARRIGRNELKVINICRAFVEAQDEYADNNRLEDGTPEYASKFMSSEGKKDGLYWPAVEGEAESPFGPLIAAAAAKGYESGLGTEPYYGYHYKILTSQGPNAPGGARDYVVDGHMTRGFAMIAYPANYGITGVMTFIVDQTGIVYQKNLGPDTEKIAEDMKAFDPDKTWAAYSPD